MNRIIIAALLVAISAPLAYAQPVIIPWRPPRDCTVGQTMTWTGTTWDCGDAGITNAAGADVIVKSDGTNLVASTCSDDGSTVTCTGAVTLNGNLTSGNGASDVFDHNGQLAKFGSTDGYVYVYDDEVNFDHSTNATETGYINKRGYNGGLTQFRNLVIGDGKGADACTFTGSTKTLNCIGGLQVNGTNVNAFTTANTIPKGNGSGLVASSWTDAAGVSTTTGKLHVKPGSSGLTATAGVIVTIENTGANSYLGFLNNTNDMAIEFGNSTAANDGGIYYNTARTMTFRTGSGNRMTIDSSGNATFNNNVTVGNSLVAGDSTSGDAHTFNGRVSGTSVISTQHGFDYALAPVGSTSSGKAAINGNATGSYDTGAGNTITAQGVMGQTSATESAGTGTLIAIATRGLAQSTGDESRGIQGEALGAAGINYGGWFNAANGASNVALYTHAGEVRLNASSGNTGIGDTTPANKLTVNGSISTTSAGGFWTNEARTIGMSESGTSLSFRTNNLDSQMTIENDGSVCVGTTTCTSTFHVAGTASTSGETRIGAAGSAPGFYLAGSETADQKRLTFEASDGADRFWFETDLDGTNANDLLVLRSSTADNALVLQGGGDIGIGAADPLARLHVRGSGGATGLTPTTGTVVAIENTASNNYLSMLSDTNESALVFGNSTSSIDGGVFYTATRDMRFRAGAGTRCTISGTTGVLDCTAGFTTAANLTTTGTGDLVVADDATVGGDLTVNGNATIGNATSDEHTTNGKTSIVTSAGTIIVGNSSSEALRTPAGKNVILGTSTFNYSLSSGATFIRGSSASSLVYIGDTATSASVELANATAATNVLGTLHTVGAADFDSTVNVDGAATLQSTLGVAGDAGFFGGVAVGDADSDVLNSRATFGVSGTDVTINSCGTGASVSGEAQSFQLSVGESSATCVVNLNRTFTSAPYCTFSAANSVAAADVASGGVGGQGDAPRISSTTTTVTLTFDAGVGAGGTAPVYNVSCLDRY